MPHHVHLLANSPGSVSPPHRPQNRCVAFHSTICFARPAILKKSSLIPENKPLRSRNTAPLGGSASVANSAAQHVRPSRTPISRRNQLASLSSHRYSSDGAAGQRRQVLRRMQGAAVGAV